MPQPLRSPISRALAVLASAVLACVALPPPAHAENALQRHLAWELALAGGHSGAYVYDLSAQRTLFAERADVSRPPASVEKLFTATALLMRLGGDARLSTRVLGTGRLTAPGVWEGNLYLRGGGDPTFGSSSFIAGAYGGVGTSLSALVSQLVGAGIRRVTGRIYGDESAFDSLRGEPSSNFEYDPFLEGALSALAFNRGQTGTSRGAHAQAAYAAGQLRAALVHAGVHVSGGSGAATTPAGASVLARALSPTIAELLALTLAPSDNFFAETLLKDLGGAVGAGGTTAAGVAVVLATIATLGIHPHILDGSGLSPLDRSSPDQVVALLRALAPTALGVILRHAMAVAGKTGTLSERMRRTPAAGRCQGKTGTLEGVSNLAGYCQALNGHLIAFALFTDGIATQAAHLIQDNITITIARQ